MTDNELKLYRTLIGCIAILLITITLCITAYQIIDMVGPVRPKYSSIYYWPPNTGGTVIPGSNNQVGGESAAH
jgi:hypothetical protein